MTLKNRILEKLDGQYEPVPVSTFCTEFGTEARALITEMALEFEVWLGTIGPKQILHVASSEWKTLGP